MTVASTPCIGICRMSEASGLCIGCRRSLAEIAGWGGMSEDARRRLMRLLPDRDPFAPSPSARAAASAVAEPGAAAQRPGGQKERRA